ncbi:hypothetical protein BDZ91DRAFT_327453 [Kalaharituber pfeilii]|nr:hypothetical protein BDZ91DRAFT_327453 [Kalaharituber pfeilii]
MLETGLRYQIPLAAQPLHRFKTLPPGACYFSALPFPCCRFTSALIGPFHSFCALSALLSRSAALNATNPHHVKEKNPSGDGGKKRFLVGVLFTGESSVSNFYLVLQKKLKRDEKGIGCSDVPSLSMAEIGGVQGNYFLGIILNYADCAVNITKI